MSRRFIEDQRYVALLCVMLGGMGQGVVAPNLSRLLNGSQRILAESGVGAGFLYLGVLLSTYSYGLIADRGKVHFLYGGGLISYALALVLLPAISSSSLLFFIVRFAEGLAISAVFVAGDFTLGRLSKNGERARWLSYYGVALSVGLLLGPALSLVMGKLSQTLAPLFSLGTVAVFALTFAGISKKIRVPPVLQKENSKTKWPLSPLLSGTTYGFMEAGVVAVFPILAVSELSITPEYCLAVIILVAALSSVIFGEAASRWGSAFLVRFLLFVMCGGFILLTFLLQKINPSIWAYITGVFIGILAGGIYPLGFDWLLSHFPESEYGRASGTFARAYGFGSLFGPFVLGYGSQRSGAAGMVLPLGIVGGLAFLLCFLQNTRIRSFEPRG